MLYQFNKRAQKPSLQKIINGFYSGSFLNDFPLRVSDDWLFAIFTLPRSDMRHMVRHRLILSSERVAGMGGRPPIESYVAKTSPACRTSALIDMKKENRR